MKIMINGIECDIRATDSTKTLDAISEIADAFSNSARKDDEMKLTALARQARQTALGLWEKLDKKHFFD